ncbi:MAG: 50S ribosomal protein L4 [Alphaproteobacteria bacterium]
MKCPVIDLDNKKVGDIELADAVFAAAPRPDIVQRVVLWQLARRRAGTHKVKGRSEVTGTTAKVWAQKGGGRARHGSRKASLFRGGGITFGPHPRDHGYDLPKKVRRLGLRSALSAKQADGRLVVLDQATVAEAKTSVLAGRLKALGWSNVLIIDGASPDDNFRRAAGNIPGVDILPGVGANVYDILRHDLLVVTRQGVEALEARCK